MVGKRKITILMLQDSMWQGGETYDEPGDFDEMERERGGERGIQETMNSKQNIQINNKININIQVMPGTGSTNVMEVTAEAETQGATATEPSREEERGTENLVKAVTEAVIETAKKEMGDEKETENGSSWTIVWIVISGVVICIIIVCIWLRYR